MSPLGGRGQSSCSQSSFPHRRPDTGRVSTTRVVGGVRLGEGDVQEERGEHAQRRQIGHGATDNAEAAAVPSATAVPSPARPERGSTERGG
jgi:hypothetical protein